MFSNSGLLPVLKPQVIYSYFQHPQAVCISYFEHCMFSLKLARYFAVGSFKAVVHAFFPSMYITSSSDLLVTVKEDMANIGCHKEEEFEGETEEVKEEVKSWTNRGTYVSEKDDNDIPPSFY
jgi:hypothetical protein